MQWIVAIHWCNGQQWPLKNIDLQFHLRNNIDYMSTRIDRYMEESDNIKSIHKRNSNKFSILNGIRAVIFPKYYIDYEYAERATGANVVSEICFSIRFMVSFFLDHDFFPICCDFMHTS